MTFSRSVIEYYLLTAEHFLGYLGYECILSLGNIRKVMKIILPRILWSLTQGWQKPGFYSKNPPHPGFTG